MDNINAAISPKARSELDEALDSMGSYREFYRVLPEQIELRESIGLPHKTNKKMSGVSFSSNDNATSVISTPTMIEESSITSASLRSFDDFSVLPPLTASQCSTPTWSTARKVLAVSSSDENGMLDQAPPLTEKSPVKPSSKPTQVDSCDRVKVAIRIKPSEKSTPRVWAVEKDRNGVRFLQQKGLASSVRTRYAFDHVHEEESSTKEVYESVAKPLVDAVTQGKDGTVFAYGATGSGKTHTMLGNHNSDYQGLLHMAAEDLFTQIHSAVDRDTFVKTQYFEIYNEQVRDLLAHNKTLNVLEDKNGKLVMDAEEKEVKTAEDIANVLKEGNINRASAPTSLNEQSSRSHAIFRIIVESRYRAKITETHVQGPTKRVSVLNLVDLAGSENSTQAGVSFGARKQEGGNINQSLLTLSQVIHALSLPSQRRPKFIPFRSSKLTRIMKPQLSGNACLAVLCCVSLNRRALDETKTTLKFASAAKKISVNPTVNEVTDNEALVETLQKELFETRIALRQLQDRLSGSHDEERSLEDIADTCSEVVIGEGVENPDEYLSQAPKSVHSADEEPPLRVVYVKNRPPSPVEEVSTESPEEDVVAKTKFLEDQLSASDAMADALFLSLKKVKLEQLELERLYKDVHTADDIRLLQFHGSLVLLMALVALFFLFNGHLELFVGTVGFLLVTLEVAIC